MEKNQVFISLLRFHSIIHGLKIILVHLHEKYIDQVSDIEEVHPVRNLVLINYDILNV
jgi:hypothetical protein